MPKHFLHSPRARTLSLADLMLSEDEARKMFQDIRWSDNGGQPYCPKCGDREYYTISTRNLWKCKGCSHQYSITSGTILHSRKMNFQKILMAILVYANGRDGHAALRLCRDIGCSYTSAFVLLHKVRETIWAEKRNQTVTGDTEIDGVYIGGHVRKPNLVKNRKKHKYARTGKRKSVVVARERGENGRIIVEVFANEADAVDWIESKVQPGSTIYADDASWWDRLTAKYHMERVNHSSAGYSVNGISTNLAESYNSRLRKVEVTHRYISGRYLREYANEAAWREERRRWGNGDIHFHLSRAALQHPKSRRWAGYWQRGPGVKLPPGPAPQNQWRRGSGRRR